MTRLWGPGLELAVVRVSELGGVVTPPADQPMGDQGAGQGPRPQPPHAHPRPSTAAARGATSGTPLAKKIGIKPGHQVRVFRGPGKWEITGLPEGCTVAAGGPAGADVTIAFYRSISDLSGEASGLVEELADHAMLWIAWPRRAAGHDSDITDSTLRDLLLPLGVVDVKVAALGEDWSGLKFVRRRENRWRP